MRDVRIVIAEMHARPWRYTTMDVVIKETAERCDIESHAEHLCYLLSQGFHLDDADAYQALIQNPCFRCSHCGRAAAGQKNLCVPVPL
jgi:hypothetical protein